MGSIVYKFLTALMSFLLAFASILGISTEKKIQNVILLIGDGMGEMHLEMTKDMRGIPLTMDELPQQGKVTTRSASSKVTDSAAAGTALATGSKTKNGMVGMYWPDDPDFDRATVSYPKNITEVCMENGLKTGVITTDHVTGATPAAFTSHTEGRSNSADITYQQIRSGIDLIWGKEDSTVTEEQAVEQGYTYIDTLEELNALTGNEKSYGMFTHSLHHPYNVNAYTPTLSQMTEKAIELLDTTAENGFFLMVEGAHIDKNSHNQDEEAAAEALEEFDNAVKAALEFAKEDGNTLIIVTADHETGGVMVNAEGKYEMPTGDHTATNVPVRAYAPGDYTFIDDGEIIDNTQIPVRIVKALEFSGSSIPFEVVITP